MLFKEALEITNRLTPNLYSEADRRRWLLTLEKQIFEEVVLTHEGGCCRSIPTGEDCEELIVPDKYAEDVYVNWLQARIHKENAEDAKYNAAVTRYNAAYTAFCKWYNARHRVIPRGIHYKI